MVHCRSLDASLCFSDKAGFLRKPLPGGGLAFLRTACDCEGLRKALANPDKLFDNASAILKDSRSTKVALSEIDGLGKVFVKRHNSKSLRYALRYLFRKARAFRNWEAAWLLEQLNVPTPRPIAVVAFRKALFLKSSFLITEPVEGLLLAPEFLKILLGSGLEEFLLCVFKSLALMHNSGISHGDLKFSNLAAVKGHGGKLVFAGFMDLDSFKRRRSSLPEKERILELARMAASLCALSAEQDMTMSPAEACQLLARCYEAAGGMKLDPESILAAAKLWME